MTCFFQKKVRTLPALCPLLGKEAHYKPLKQISL